MAKGKTIKSLDYESFAKLIKGKVFYIDRNTEVTADVINEYVDSHQKLMPLYDSLEDLYYGAHKIYYDEKKEDGKPDYRIAVNFAKYIVDTSNGFFNSSSIQITHPSRTITEAIDLYRRINSEDDNDAEVSKLSTIYGHAYKFTYEDQIAEKVLNTDLHQIDSSEPKKNFIQKAVDFVSGNAEKDEFKKVEIPLNNIRTTYVKPTEGFVVYANDVTREPLFCVVYSSVSDDGKEVSAKVYKADEDVGYWFNRDSQASVIFESSKESKEVEEFSYNLKGIPLTEFMENEERIGRIETVANLIDAFNKTVSEKANDVAYFADNLLHVDGVKLDENQKGDMRDKKLLNTYSDKSKVGESGVTAKFLDKPNNDEGQEHLLDRLERLIYQMAMVYNANDEDFSNAASGISLEYKLKNMKNLAHTKERKFRKAFRRQYEVLFTNWGLGYEYLNLDYKFSFDIPIDKKQLAEIGNLLVGQVSDKTRLENMQGIVSDVDQELDRLEEQGKDKTSSIDEMYGFGKNQPSKKEVTEDEE